MREFQQKHLMRKIVYSRFMVVFLFLCVVVLLRSISELNDKRMEVKLLEADSFKERETLLQKLEKARAKNNYISTTRGKEEYVRTTFPVVKNGEGVIVVYDGEKGVVAPVRSDISIWEKFILWWKAK